MEKIIAGVTVDWRRSIRTKIGIMSGMILAVLVAGYAGHRYMLGVVRENGQFLQLCTEGARYKFEVQTLADVIADPRYRAERRKNRARVREIIAENAARYDALLLGNPAAGLPPLQDGQARQLVEESKAGWLNDFLPRLEVLVSNAPDGDLVTAHDEMTGNLLDFGTLTKKIVEREETVLADYLERFETIRLVYFSLSAIAAFLILWSGLKLASRIMGLTRTAEAIASGDLTAPASVEGEDEVAALSVSMNTMTESLHGMVETERKRREELDGVLVAMRETMDNLSSASAEILAAAAAQASGAQDSAAAVTQTVTTVDEIGKTAEQAVQRAKAVADSTRRAVETGMTGRKAVEDTIAVMRSVREQSESIAQSILALAEQAQAIGEIAAAINDIADQLNLLALNATIEASRAGEQGKGFAVVATEVRALADQAKKATVQVRQILDASQKNTNAAVIATEEGNKRVGDAVRISGEAGETIRVVAELIAEASEAAVQTAAGVGQQATGMSQVTQALRNIDTANRQNLSSTRKTEKAIQKLTVFGDKMKAVLERSRN